MAESIEVATGTATFDGDLDEAVARARTLAAREIWPGVRGGGTGPDKLYFTMTMSTRSAAITDLDISEALSPVVQDGETVKFTTAQSISWPTGVTAVMTEYRFTRGGKGSPHTLQFTYRYPTPGKSLVKPKDLPANRATVEKVVQRYTEKLVGSVPART